MSRRVESAQPDKIKLTISHEQVQSDIEKFIESGGKIETVEFGVTGDREALAMQQNINRNRRKLMHAKKKLEEKRAKEPKAKSNQQKILELIELNPGIESTEICKALNFGPSTVKSSLYYLYEYGKVNRKRKVEGKTKRSFAYYPVLKL